MLLGLVKYRRYFGLANVTLAYENIFFSNLCGINFVMDIAEKNKYIGFS